MTPETQVVTLSLPEFPWWAWALGSALAWYALAAVAVRYGCCTLESWMTGEDRSHVNAEDRMFWWTMSPVVFPVAAASRLSRPVRLRLWRFLEPPADRA